MLKAKEVDEAIRVRMTMLAAYVHLSNQNNLQDINVFSEKVAGGLLNLTWDTELKDLNTYEDQNFPGVDLGDDPTKLCVQVTSTDRRGKIEKTIKAFEDHELHKRFATLRVVVLKTDMVRYQKDFTTNGQYTFTKDDVLCIDNLYKQIKALSDEKIAKIKDFLCDSIPLSEATVKTAEMMLLKQFFQKVGKQDEKEVDDPEIDQSDFEEKQRRFDAFWTHIQETYVQIKDPELEKAFARTSNSLSQSERESISRYLRYQSMCLLLEEENPIKVIDKLKTKIVEETQSHLISEVKVLNFLYYQFFRCNVLPNPVGGAA